MALCHSVELDPQDRTYNATSPDEGALVNGAKECGYEFKDKDRNKLITLGIPKTKDIPEHDEKWQLLNTFEFSSERRRMSVVVQNTNEKNKVHIFCKGADQMIETLLNTEK